MILCRVRNRRIFQSSGQLRRLQCAGGDATSQLIKNLNLKFEESFNEQNYRQRAKKREELLKIMSENDFWEKNPNAIPISQEFNELNTQHLAYQEIMERYREAIELYQLAESENDEALLEDCQVTLQNITSELDQRKLDSILLMDEGKSSCYVEIVAGSGGLDAFDWTKMLSAMYCNWGVFMGYRVSLIDENIEDYPGCGAGYRRVTLRVDGDKAYGHLAAEAGVHRLVRISPYDPKERRHTSFSQVRVYPVLESLSNKVDSSIDPSDLRIDTYRARGNGGQAVNTTDSAVRITHLPTGIVVTCQNERSQIMNKGSAMKVLKAKLHQLDKERKKELKKNSTLGLGENSWGNQIRSVVLQPYTLVKDHRSGWETSNAQGLLEGTQILTNAIESYLLFAHR